MKKLARIEHLQFSDVKYTRVEYHNETFEWYDGWNTLDKIKFEVSKEEYIAELEEAYRKMEEEHTRKQIEKFMVLEKNSPFQIVNNPEPNVSAFFDPGLTGKPFAKLLVRPVQDKAFSLKGEQYDRQKMFDYNIGEHILPGSLINSITELIMQREVQEITITRFHWNVSEEKGL